MQYINYEIIDSETSRALKDMGIIEPTEIQEKAIPKILKSKESHILAQAKTGSGKTLAFSIPVVESIDRNEKNVQAVIITPTRELTRQIYKVIKGLTKYNKVSVVKIYGGVSYNPQINKIKNGAQIIVATPGRLIDLYKKGVIDFDNVKFVVLDEADRMLDMGFFPDIEYLLLDAMYHAEPRLLCFSATMLREIDELGKKFTKGQHVIKINVSEDDLTVEHCDQSYYLVKEFRDKFYHFIRILKQEKPTHCIIFVNTKKTGNWLYKRLKKRKDIPLKIDVIMGSLSQNQRETVLNKFKSRKINCLIATDVAARGLDIPDVTHVFNYDIPAYEEVYVHRIGRTARISSESGNVERGKAISLVMEDEYRFLVRIEGYQEKEIKKKPLPKRHFKSKKRRKKAKKRRTRKNSRRNFLY